MAWSQMPGDTIARAVAPAECKGPRNYSSWEWHNMEEAKRYSLQDAYIIRILDSMDWNDLAQYVYDKLDEELDELSDEHLIEQVGEYYPDLLTEE
jgi:hypothetical protein